MVEPISDTQIQTADLPEALQPGTPLRDQASWIPALAFPAMESAPGGVNTLTNETTQPELPRPDYDTASYAILLTGLQFQILNNRITAGKISIQHQDEQMQDTHASNTENILDFYDKLEEAESKSTGFFGKLFGGLKKLFEGDLEGAVKDFEEGFEANPFTAAVFTAFCAYAFACGAPLLLINATTGAVFFGPAALSDPEVQKMIVESTGDDPESVSKWCMGFSISLAVIEGIIMGLATGGVGLGVGMSIAAGMAVALIQGGIMTEAGIRSSQATKAESEAMSYAADADRDQATYTGLHSDLQREMDYLQGVFDTIASIMSSAIEILKGQAGGLKAAATI